MLKSIKGVEIFAAGKWNGDVYTEKDLDAIVASFDHTGFVPPLKLGHDENQSLLQRDGMPSAGWVEKVYRKGKKLVADFKDIPEKIFNLIKNKAYNQVSAEIYWNLEVGDNVFSRALKAVALLGADIPAVADLKSISEMFSGIEAECKIYAFNVAKINIETDFIKTKDYRAKEYQTKGIKFVIGRLKDKTTTTVQTVIFDKTIWSTESAKKWLSDHDMRSDKTDITENSIRFRQKDPGDFEDGSLRTIIPGENTNNKHDTGEEKKKEKKKMSDEMVAQMKEQMKALEDKVSETEKSYSNDIKDRDSRIESLQSEIKNLELKRNNESARNYVEALMAKGKILPKIKAEVYTLLCDLFNFDSGKVVKYTDSENKGQESTRADLFKFILEALPTSVDFSESAPKDDKASKDEDPGMRLNKLAKDYMREHSNTTYAEAFAYIAAQNPDLAKEYRENV